jgi:hypothetical protein
VRGAARCLAVCGAIVAGLTIVQVGSGAAKPAASGAAPARSSGEMAGVTSSSVKRANPLIRASTPVPSSFFAGYEALQTGSSSASTTFRVPNPNCGASDSGVAPGIFFFTGPSGSENLEAAGVLSQCISGVVTIQAALVVGGIETNFSNTIRVGDVMEADVSVGAGGTSVTIKDLTGKRAFTQTLTGSDTAPDAEIIGDDTTTVNGNSVPLGPVAASRFTASTVGGAALMAASPKKVILVNGCSVLLQPGPIDSTGMIFTVSIPKIDVNAINPTVDPTGTNVEIDGYGFNATSVVKFHGVAATTVTHDSATMMHAVVPTSATTGPISVTNASAPKGSITSACDFFVSPMITTMTPISGRTGSSVTIKGSGLQPSAKVTLGTKTMTITSKSGTQLKVTVPNGGATGTITVTTPSGSATITPFTVTFSITSLSPLSGPHGTVVTINGVGFNASSVVKFNGVVATNQVLVSSTRLRATVPPTASSGPVTVTNTTAPTGTVQAATHYTVTADVAPTVTSFSPGSGAVGDPVTITGVHFSGASTVKFGNVNATFHVVSDTQISTTVPSGAVTGPISVTNAIGTGMSSSSFTVT